jgi:hypothetical protein
VVVALLLWFIDGIRLWLMGFGKIKKTAIEAGQVQRTGETMHVLMIVLALSTAGLMGWRLIKERRRAGRRRAIRQRQDVEASQNWKAAQERGRRDSLG